MNMRRKLFAGPILCMLALSVVLTASTARGAEPAPGPAVTPTTEGAGAEPAPAVTPAAEGARSESEPAVAPEAEGAGSESEPVVALAAEGAEAVSTTAADESAEDSSSAVQEMLSGRGLSMDVSYGYDNRAKGGRYVPVDVTVYNQNGAEVTGKLKLLTMESDYDIYRYEYPVTIPAAGAAASQSEDLVGAGNTADSDAPHSAGVLHKHVYVPMGNRSDRMFVSLTDAEDNLILHERVELDFSVDMPELFIGTLTDSPELLTAWDGIGVDYSMLRTEVVNFDTETFPKDEMGLDVIDVLLISNFRIRDLSAEQSQVLVEWVRSGGTMILGTGERADDTLGRFAPELLEESYDPPETREVDMGDRYAQESPDDATLTIPCLEFSLAGGDVIFSDEQQALVASVSYGKGTIAVAAYDFADISDFCSRNPAYLDDLLTAVLGESRLSELSQEIYSGNSDRYWSVRNMINTGNVRRLPNLNLYTLELVIYLLLTGLVIYIFLKQRDLTDYYRRTVVVLSLLFTAIIYFMGSRTRFTGTFYNYARFLETTFDSVSETSYVNIRAPYNRAYQARVPSGYSLKPVTRSFYSEESAPGFTGGESPTVDLSFGPEETVISIQGVPAFEPRYFQMNKVTENTDFIGFDGDLEIDGGKLTGSVTNLFAETVRGCTLLFNNRLICLGDMEPGQTVELDGLEALEYPKNASYQVAAYLSGESEFEQADISSEEYVEASEKSDMLSFYLDNHMPYFSVPSARVIGFTDTADAGGARTGRDGEGITMVSSSVAVYSSDETVLYRSGLVKTPRVLGGSYDSEANVLYGIDPVTLEYSFGTDVQVEKLEFDYVSEVFTETAGSDLAVFTGNIYFYNHLTGVYDWMDPEKTEYGAHELLPYLTDGNLLTVRYVYDNVNQYNWNILLPMLNIVGREY